jgi:ATP-dependent DNA helicase RecG
MSRLLEGDTGSGKTVVAAAAILHVIKANWQVCLLAPMEILARQHLKTLTKLLRSFGIKPILLVGSTPDSEKKEIIKGLKNGEIQLVVGTHALIQERVGFNKLGLAIIDEQHRFGVRQREILKTYGSPHVLSLTATPIPRTLALILYGDQELSVLDEMPPNRQKIFTRIVPESKRKDAYKWIEKEIEKGRQAFIIFPLIEESPDLEVKAAVQEFERLKNDIFPHLKVGLLHGQMKPIDKEEIMNSFSNNEIQILVSTAVVELGVDVPNATIMMIEGAERFGLAQLHQFRGRVGRGSEQSYCFLFPTLQIPQVMNRLNALVKHDSGFALAEIDLSLRGPGEVYGTAQSGIPDLKMANLSDSLTIKQSRDAANEIIENDPELTKYPELKEKIIEQENIAIDY